MSEDRQVMNIQSVQGKMLTYAEVDKNVIFPKHILQYESGNAETKKGFGNHGMSGVSPCAVGRQLRTYGLLLRNWTEEANTTQAVTRALGFKPC